jgi:hypothetical protein
MAAREERVLTQRVPAARSASPEHLGHLLHCSFDSDFRFANYLRYNHYPFTPPIQSRVIGYPQGF